jgi:hypothetical protein
MHMCIQEPIQELALVLPADCFPSNFERLLNLDLFIYTTQLIQTELFSSSWDWTSQLYLQK